MFRRPESFADGWSHSEKRIEFCFDGLNGYVAYDGLLPPCRQMKTLSTQHNFGHTNFEILGNLTFNCTLKKSSSLGVARDDGGFSETANAPG
jgi:hypothetical protein